MSLHSPRLQLWCGVKSELYSQSGEAAGGQHELVADAWEEQEGRQAAGDQVIL